MEKEYEVLRDGILKMEVVTVQAAQDLTGLSKKEILDFVQADKSLRIFDVETGLWINENAKGHC